jgi:hypothetical protein
VSIGTGRTKRTVTVLVGSAGRAVVLVGDGEGWKCRLEVGQEGQVRKRGAGRVEDLISDSSGHVACWMRMDGAKDRVRVDFHMLLLSGSFVLGRGLELECAHRPSDGADGRARAWRRCSSQQLDVAEVARSHLRPRPRHPVRLSTRRLDSRSYNPLSSSDYLDAPGIIGRWCRTRSTTYACPCCRTPPWERMTRSIALKTSFANKPV